MNNSFLKTSNPRDSKEELSAIYHRHVDTVYRVCYMHTKSVADAQDMVQDTFVRLINSNVSFQSHGHEKAWLIRTAINLCINHLKHWRRKTVDIDKLRDMAAEIPVEDETIKKVKALPVKYKNAIYLHYYEGYTTAEIAKITGSNASTIRSHLMKGRRLLKLELESEENEA